MSNVMERLLREMHRCGDWMTVDQIAAFAESEVLLALEERERQQRSGDASVMCGPGKCQRLEDARAGK